MTMFTLTFDVGNHFEITMIKSVGAILMLSIVLFACKLGTSAEKINPNGNGQTISKESDEITNAKWYYYSYATELKAYDKSGTEVQPLACDIKLLRVSKVSVDTTKLYFVASNRDSLNICSFRPLDLVGITVVRNRLYLPIYHTIAFESESDSVVLETMNKQNLLLQTKVLENKGNINVWLQAEAKKRKIIE